MNDPHQSTPDTPSHTHGLDPCEFNAAIEKAEELAKRLRADYPLSKPYLVIAIKGECVKHDTLIHEQLETAPSIFVDNATKIEVQKHLRSTPPLELSKKENESRFKQYKDARDKRLTKLLADLKYKPDALFEIRVGNLHYEEIWRMQKDPKVDASRTPQTKASIRIVLGSLDDFLLNKIAKE